MALATVLFMLLHREEVMLSIEDELDSMDDGSDRIIIRPKAITVNEFTITRVNNLVPVPLVWTD